MTPIEISAGYKKIPGFKKKIKITYNYLKHTSNSKFRQWTIENLNKALVGEIRFLKVNSIIDVGCGEGFTLERLRKEKVAKSLFGVDGSSIAIKLGKKLFPKLILKVQNIYDLPIKDNSFDLVVCTEVLEHLKEPNKALKELVRVSKKYLE